MSMNVRRGDGRDIASRIATIEQLTMAARYLVDAGSMDLAQDALDTIAHHIRETP